MFDPTNTTHLQQLKSEVLNDPIGMGYVKSDNSDIRQKINHPASNVGGETGSEEATVGMLMKHLDLTELAALNQAQQFYVEMVLHWQPDTLIDFLRSRLVAIFGVQSNTVQGVASELVPLSRAEVLWGEGTQINRDNLVAARKV